MNHFKKLLLLLLINLQVTFLHANENNSNKLLNANVVTESTSRQKTTTTISATIDGTTSVCLNSAPPKIIITGLNGNGN